jgi:hypothetical protein
MLQQKEQAEPRSIELSCRAVAAIDEPVENEFFHTDQ